MFFCSVSVSVGIRTCLFFGGDDGSDRSDQGGEQDDQDHIDLEVVIGEECSDHNQDQDQGAELRDPASHIVDDGDDDCTDSGSHSAQHILDKEVFFKCRVECGDRGDDHKRRKNRTENREEDSGHARELVSDDDRSVDSNRAR